MLLETDIPTELLDKIAHVTGCSVHLDHYGKVKLISLCASRVIDDYVVYGVYDHARLLFHVCSITHG